MSYHYRKFCEGTSSNDQVVTFLSIWNINHTIIKSFVKASVLISKWLHSFPYGTSTSFPILLIPISQNEWSWGSSWITMFFRGMFRKSPLIKCIVIFNSLLTSPWIPSVVPHLLRVIALWPSQMIGRSRSKGPPEFNYQLTLPCSCEHDEHYQLYLWHHDRVSAGPQSQSTAQLYGFVREFNAPYSWVLANHLWTASLVLVCDLQLYLARNPPFWI